MCREATSLPQTSDREQMCSGLAGLPINASSLHLGHCPVSRGPLYSVCLAPDDTLGLHLSVISVLTARLTLGTQESPSVS